MLVYGSHDGICVPFSGLAGGYEFTPRKAQYAITHHAFFSGYKHFHSIKVETVMLPNGISTLNSICAVFWEWLSAQVLSTSTRTRTLYSILTIYLM